MKEISLQELLNMAERPAHDGIVDLWNQKAIHHLVVFTSPDQDFEIIGVGPTLPCATLDDAGKHAIAGKSPELYVKCPAAIAGKLQPKLAPAHLAAAKGGAPLPTVKGKTSVPFVKPAIKLNAPAAAAAKTAAPPPPTPAPVPQPEAFSPKPETAAAQATANTDGAGGLAARRDAIVQREQELSALAAALKVRETALRQREDAVAAREEKLLEAARKLS